MYVCMPFSAYRIMRFDPAYIRVPVGLNATQMAGSNSSTWSYPAYEQRGAADCRSHMWIGWSLLVDKKTALEGSCALIRGYHWQSKLTQTHIQILEMPWSYIDAYIHAQVSLCLHRNLWICFELYTVY